MKKDHSASVSKALRIIDSPTGIYFKDILEQKIHEAVQTSQGENFGNVISSVRLTDTQKNTFKKDLFDIFKREIELEFTVNKDLIAGFKIAVGDWKLDTSLNQQLNNLVKSLS